MKGFQKSVLAGLMALVLCLGLLPAVPAYAASGTSAGGLNGDSGKWAEFDESVYDEVVSISTIKNAQVNGYTWPSSGTVLLEESGSLWSLEKCKGITIPAGLVVDIYKYYQSAGMTEPVYQLLGHFDTTDGSPYTIGTAKTNVSSSGSTVAGFTDVHSTDYYADAVKWAKEAGVTAGTNTAGTTFSPASTVTRAEAVTFLWRAAGEPAPKSTGSPFSDVTDPSAYYYKAVLWAAEQGITNGTGGTSFGLNGTLAYDQILTFLCRAAGVSASGSDWSSAAVSWAKQNGLTDGLSFTAKADCPRSDVVYFLWNQLADEQFSEKEEQAEVPVGLSDEEGAKAAIINGFLNRETRIAVSSYNIESSEMRKLANEIADIDGKNPYNISTLACNEADGRRALFLGVGYLMQISSAADESEGSAEVQARVKSIVDSVVTSGMSDYDIAKALHDWLVLNCEYDMRLYSGDMPYTAYTAYGALMDGTAVCAGYARAYRLLMESAGISCEYVSGNTTRGRHAWNIVQIDGEWYHVDTTWDDPIPNKEGYIRYNYFLRSDTAIGKDHSNWTASYTCTSTKYDSTTLPNTTEQARLEAQAAEQERLDGVADEVFAFLSQAIDSLPYRTADELQAAEALTSDDAYPKISFPSGQFTASDLNKLRVQLKEAISDKYPDCELMSISSSSCQIKRSDVLQEMERRKAIQQEELAEQERQAELQKQEQQAAANARLAEIEALLQEAIQTGASAHYNITLPESYSYMEIKTAINNMGASGYSFGDYTSADYSLSVTSVNHVAINNYKWKAEMEAHVAEIEATIQEAIRNQQAQVVISEDYTDSEISQACQNMRARDYSFDDYTGQDYTLSLRGNIVSIFYPD